MNCRISSESNKRKSARQKQRITNFSKICRSKKITPKIERRSKMQLKRTLRRNQKKLRISKRDVRKRLQLIRDLMTNSKQYKLILFNSNESNPERVQMLLIHKKKQVRCQNKSKFQKIVLIKPPRNIVRLRPKINKQESIQIS